MERLTAQQIENLPEWMTVRDFEGFYEVNCRAGLVRNARTLRVREPNIGKVGYPIVGLYKDGKRHTKSVHRLVALAAFGYYNISTDGLDVCHLDEERNDPRIVNLVLGSRKENINFPKAKQRLSDAMKGKKNPWYGKRHSKETIKKMSEAKPKKTVGAYKNGVLVMKFESSHEAGRNGFNRGAVGSCCIGRRKAYKGFEWRFL